METSGSIPQPVRISSQMSRLSIRVQPLRLGSDDEPSVTATGFLWSEAGQLFLVTNLHNVTGWDYGRSRAISATGMTPDALKLHLEVIVNVHGDINETTTWLLTYPILDEDGRPGWLWHPTFRERVDVAVLPLGPAPFDEALGNMDPPAALATVPVNEHPDWVDFDVDAGDDAFVLGYPHGLNGGGGLPIWKRASLASEPDFDLDGLPKLLIDTATRAGMSGSPVVAVRRGFIQARSGSIDDSLIGQADRFLGVYSGRLGDDPMGLQLGIVWKARVISEIIAGGRTGRLPWDERTDQT